ncbi:cytochrome c [Novosphingobium piscinae]|uniref:Cytochrome c n=2 Tax=Novosphingobium piscinae TaxID=1507448 RepID=A0A7X1FZA1_9SPHN|nr:cytochrome c [Novosphingobium piscinae]
MRGRGARPARGIALSIALAALIGGMAGRAQDTAGGQTSVQVSQEGKEVYEQICQACHMADAKGGGAAGAAVPALAGNPKLADKDYPITLLLKGRGGMPWMTDLLTPAQMAAVINYVRGHFNAFPGTVTEADIKRVSSAPPPVRECNTCGM